MKHFVIVASLVFAPLMASAATLGSILGVFGSLISAATPIVVALALLFFFWGLAMYILKTGEGKAEGREMMIYGIIALFVMVSVWGLVEVVRSSFDVRTASITVPAVTGGSVR